MLTTAEKFTTVLRHIRRVEENCNIIALKFLDTNVDFACQLVRRGRMHDVTKFDGFEWQHLWSWDEQFPIALRIHRNKNRHHAEYHDDITKMSDLDVAEMVCDCAARATEFGTSIREWFNKPEYEPIKPRIDYFLSLLLRDPFVYPKF